MYIKLSIGYIILYFILALFFAINTHCIINHYIVWVSVIITYCTSSMLFAVHGKCPLVLVEKAGGINKSFLRHFKVHYKGYLPLVASVYGLTLLVFISASILLIQSIFWPV